MPFGHNSDKQLIYITFQICMGAIENGNFLNDAIRFKGDVNGCLIQELGLLLHSVSFSQLQQINLIMCASDIQQESNPFQRPGEIQYLDF